MHEFSLVENIFKIIDNIIKKENLRKIDKINLIVGEMLQIVPETLIFAFDAVKKETIYCKTAEINIESKPITIECNICNKNIVLKKDEYLCPQCKKNDYKIISGKELIIKSIDGE